MVIQKKAAVPAACDQKSYSVYKGADPGGGTELLGL